MLKNISIILKRSGITAFALMAFAVVPGTAMASAIVVDGIRTLEETTLGLSPSLMTSTPQGAGTGSDGGEYGASFVTTWTNDHHSFYDGNHDLDGDGNPDTPLTEVFYLVSGGGSSLNLFMEAPIYARNMIWRDFTASNSTDCTDAGDPCMGLTNADVEPYLEGSHHDKGGSSTVKMDYKTMTDSEKITFGGNTYDFQNSGSNWATSEDWVLANGCTTSECTFRDVTLSYEFSLTSLGIGEADDIIQDLMDNGMVFHLSDERRAAFIPPQPPHEVPVPAAFWLFGTAIFGLIGMRRKAKLTA